MKAHWILGGGPQDPELGDTIDADSLAEHGIHAQTLPTDPSGYQAPLDDLKARRGYIEQDVVSLSPETPNLDEVCATFIDEHLHDDDEVRFVLDGDGVFDIRASDDRWMRVVVEAGDLIVVPANRYHRFMLTDARSIRCVRLFRDQSGWVPRYRSAG